jgi:hypothetical protein
MFMQAPARPHAAGAAENCTVANSLRRGLPVDIRSIA